MMQDYDFKPSHHDSSTNTSMESVSMVQPSKRVVQNVLNFARCTQCVNVRKVRIKLFLN